MVEECPGNLIEEPKGFRKIEIVTAGGEQKVLLNGQPYMSWRCEDQVAPRIAIAQLHESGLASQEELAELFGVNVKSVRNYISAFRMDGVSSLISQPRGPKESWKITADTRFKILEVGFRHRDITYEKMAKILKDHWNVDVSINSIRQVLMENGFIEERVKSPEYQQKDLFARSNEELPLRFGEGECIEAPPAIVPPKQTVESDGGCFLRKEERNRSCYSQSERIYLDQLEHGQFSAYAGGLLFAPLLECHHFREMIKQVIDVKTYEGYCLEQLCMTLFHFDLFGYRSIENFKTVYPEEFGILIGKVLSPSIYTLRRFLHRVRKLKKGEDLTKEFGKEYLKSGLVNFGVLYIDGHFMPYYGWRIITMGWHGVREKALKGSEQFLAIDEKFNPLMFLLKPSSDDLLEMIPKIINDAREIAQEVGKEGKDLTVVFDREGYSAELFTKLNKMQPEVKFITWAKYMDRWVGDYNPEQFNKSVIVEYEIQDGEEIKYFDTHRTMSKYGKIRAIVIESGEKKKRAAIYTNDDNTDAGRIIQLICRRWGQETLNKTFKLDHRMDYFPGYVAEELDEQPLVENPKLKELKSKKANLTSKLNSLRVKFAQVAFAETKDEANWKEIKERNSELCAEMNSINAEITLLGLEIEKFPKEVQFDEAHNGEKLMEFDYEKKRFLDCLKVFTYMMEKKMCTILSRYYDDPKDIYSILAMIVRRGGDTKLEGGKLRVRLREFRNPVVDYAARHLCEDLNQMKPHTLDKFNLPIRYEVG